MSALYLPTENSSSRVDLFLGVVKESRFTGEGQPITPQAEVKVLICHTRQTPYNSSWYTK